MSNEKIYVNYEALQQTIDRTVTIAENLREKGQSIKSLAFGMSGAAASKGPVADEIRAVTEEYHLSIERMADVIDRLTIYLTQVGVRFASAEDAIVQAAPAEGA